MAEWFKNEGFWQDLAPVMFDEKRWAEVPAVVDALETLAGFRPPMRVLDACCGVGRHAVELASRGYRVTGVDSTRAYLDAADESALDEGVAPEFVRADVREFTRPAGFEAAVNLFTSFGYFPDFADEVRFVDNVFESLVPGGVFVIDVLGKEIEARDFIEGEWFERGGRTVLTEFSIVGPWEFLRNRWILVDDSGRREYSFDRRLYSGKEIEALLLSRGFSEVALYGDYSGSPYDQKASVLLAVAKKGK
jgi:SAM-dependent methyltransferase